METKTKNWTPKFIALAVICLVIGAGIGLLGYHYLFKSDLAIFHGMKVPEENPAKLIYPNDVINTIFDDSEKINNTVGFLIKCYKPLTENQIQVLRDSGVRLLQTSEIATIYHGLLEENKIEEVESLDFVEYVYPYKTREKTREFCGWSTYAKCKTDVDCNMGGCSGQVCEGKGEGTITDCEARDCYYIAGYGCKCIDGKCQWSSIVEKISMWQNGEELISYPREPFSKYNLRVNNIIKTLHRLNIQATCVVLGYEISEEYIQKIKQKDRIVEIVFKNPRDITINQWVQPENYIEGYHLPVNRILRNVKTAIFILEDNLDDGLEGHILIGHGGFEDEGGITIVYSCWVIQQEGSNELDKSWINEIRFKGG